MVGDIMKLAEVIAFSIKTKNKTPEDVGALCMCTGALVRGWMAGTAVPDKQRWGFLCSRLDRALFTYGGLYLGALTELTARAQAPAIGSGVLASKLTEALKVLKTMPDPGVRLVDPTVQLESNPPAPVSDPPKAPEPTDTETRSARTSAALLALPPRWRSKEKIRERQDSARMYFRTHPHARVSDCDAMLIAKFGVGVSSTTLSHIRDEERRIIDAKQATAATATPTPVIPEPAPVTPPTEPTVEAAVTVDDQLQVAFQIIMEALPNLAEMIVTVSPAGEVSYRVREARVVESSGRMTRPR